MADEDRLWVRVSVVERVHVRTGEHGWGLLVEIEGELDRWMDAANEQEARAMADDYVRLVDEMMRERGASSPMPGEPDEEF